MRVLLVSNGHFDSFLPLVAALDSEIDCTANIQIEEDTLRQSALDYPIANKEYGVGVEDKDTERIRAGINQLVGKKLKLVFTKYPTRSFRDTANWKVSLEWLRWFKKNDFDLVHYNGTSMLFFQQILMHQSGAKVFSIHDYATHLGEDAPQVRWLYRYMVARKNHRFIAHSHFGRRGFMEEYNVEANRITTVRYGALELYKKWEDPSVQAEPNTILFFGRISPYKGLEYLAEAWKVIKECNKDARLIIAGSGNFYFDITALQSDPRVEIHNRHINNAELVGFIERASVVVLPYVEATQSGVVMTAYAFNKPVVVTSVGALPEVVEDGITGRVVPPKDARRLADAVVELLSDPTKREEMKRRISEKMINEFSWDAIARETVGIYQAALGRGEDALA